MDELNLQAERAKLDAITKEYDSFMADRPAQALGIPFSIWQKNRRAAPVAQLDADLPPLPDAWGTMYSDALQEKEGYTADQMRGYAIDHAMQYVERIRHLERELAEIREGQRSTKNAEFCAMLERFRNGEITMAEWRAHRDGRTAGTASDAAPEGFALVPLEPTPKMLAAAFRLDLSYMPGQESADREAIYRAMIAAAPSTQEGAKHEN